MDAARVTRRDVLKLGGAALTAAAAGGFDVAGPRSTHAQTPKRGGVLRIRGEDPLGFDPHLTVSFRTMTNLSFTHSRLVKVKAGPSVRPGTTPIEPDLAESWTQPGETTFVFALRKGVRWHPKPPVNGRELTAEDVKYTYERFLTIKGNPNRSGLERVEKIEALDRYTVRFTLREPFAWFLDKLAGTAAWILPREAVEQFGDVKRPEACIGTGPWMLERYEPNVRLVFVRNPLYFLSDLPYADAVEVTVDSDPSSRTAAWLAGRYDFAPEYGMVVRRIDLGLVRSRKPGLQTAEFVPLVGGITQMRMEQNPFKDVRVRRALAVAGNWREVMEADPFAAGHGVPNPIIPAAFREWSIPLDALPPEGRALYQQDRAEARRLLREAGYPSGFRTPVESTPGYGPDFVDAVQIVLKNWKAVGVDADLRLKEYGAFLSRLQARSFDNVAIGLRGSATDPDGYLVPCLPGEPWNTAGVDDAKLTEMIRLQRRTFDRARRREILYDIQRYLSQHVYYLYGPSGVSVAAWESYVRGFAPNIGHDYGGRLLGVWLDR